MKSPKVTVVIPNYNHQRYLERRIQSVLDQTYTDFEVLYLDDASTDQSQQVFARFEADPRIRAILNTQNSGSPFKQWDKGVSEARGEYIWIAEADDYAHPRLLETLVGMLEQHPQAGIAYCLSWMVDKHDALLGQLPNDAKTPEPRLQTDESQIVGAGEALMPLQNWDAEPWARSFIADGPQFYRHFMIYENKVPNASATVFRRDVYRQSGGADAEMRVCGDYLAWIKMLKIADVIYTTQPLNFFRMHFKSVRITSNKTGVWALERYQVAQYILGDIGDELEPAEIDHLCHIRMGHWLEDFFTPTRRVPLKRTLELFHMARRTDPKFWPRLVWQTAFFLLHRSPLFERIRDLARRFVWRMRAKA